MKKLLTIFICLLPFLTEAQTTYYVSATGSDAANGTSTSTPFQTITKVNSLTLVAGDQVLFNRGDTFYGSLRISQSGSSGSPITIGAYGTGAKPIITGFTSVSSWTNLGSNIWESTSAVSTLSIVNVVMINNVTIPMGATPNRDLTYPFLPNFYPYQSHTGTGQATTTVTSSSLDGTNWTGADIVVRANHWTLDKESITASSGTTLTYEGQAPGTDGAGIVDGWGFFIQNDPRTLNVQNEWYYNPTTKKIRIYSTATPGTIQVSTQDTLMYTTRSYLVFDNINFTGANNLAMLFAGDNETVTNCDFSFTGLNVIEGQAVLNNFLIDGNYFHDFGGAGIRNSDAGTNWTITNNRLVRCNLVTTTKANDYTYAPINIFSPGAIVQYNYIDSTGYEGIHFRGANITVKNNLVNHTSMLRDDGGAIYTGFAGETGKTIDHNIAINTVGNGRGISGGETASQGIYADGLTDGVTITNNFVANITNAGILMNNDTAMVIRNNYIYNAGGNSYTKSGIMIQGIMNPPYDGYARNNTVTNNILFSKRAGQYGVLAWEQSSSNTIQNFGVLDSNLYVDAIDNDVAYYRKYTGTSTALTFSAWQTASGQEGHGTNYAGNGSIDTTNLKMVYNATKNDSTITLDANYKDIKGVAYNGNITLTPYTGAVLIYVSPLATVAAPTISVSGNQNITVGNTSINATAGWASGHTGTYLWTKISGPGTTTIESPTTFSTTVSNLQTGTYVFRCTLTQDDSQTVYGEVTIYVTIPIIITPGNKLILKTKFKLVND